VGGVEGNDGGKQMTSQEQKLEAWVVASREAAWGARAAEIRAARAAERAKAKEADQQ